MQGMEQISRNDVVVSKIFLIYLSESFVPCASILNVPTFKTFLSFKDGLISTFNFISSKIFN